jgi:SAM-dependent methyltransferase
MTMTTKTHPADPFLGFKARQRETWADFAVNEAFTTPPAAELVAFAGVLRGQTVLDVGCGTGVVAVTAARLGARVEGVDLTPVLLDRARHNAAVADTAIEFAEGDVEALPYDDASFDVVLSQFGHMFAPRPDRALSEMLRVLKPGGRLAFSTWPPEHGMGQLLALVGKYLPPPPPGAPTPAPPAHWGDPAIVRTRLGDEVDDVQFARGVAVAPTLSPRHTLAVLEATFGPLTSILSALQADPERVATLRAEVLGLASQVFAGNALRQQFLLTRATKQGRAVGR